MKYEVIGWIRCGTTSFPQHGTITAPVSAAIIKEIREKGYLFGGDVHENYCPVLNDGTYVSYSWRGWGDIMARAHGLTGKIDYMFAYMDRLIEKSARKYPPLSFPDVSRIAPRESLAETFVMHLNNAMFDAVKSGTKTVEARLFDDKRKLVDIGDRIEFRRGNSEDERITKRVAEIYIEETFEELFDTEVFNEKVELVKRFKPEQFGLPENSSAKAFVNAMRKIYDEEREKQYGVIGFILEEPTL